MTNLLNKREYIDILSYYNKPFNRTDWGENYKRAELRTLLKFRYLPEHNAISTRPIKGEEYDEFMKEFEKNFHEIGLEICGSEEKFNESKEALKNAFKKKVSNFKEKDG